MNIKTNVWLISQLISLRKSLKEKKSFENFLWWMLIKISKMLQMLIWSGNFWKYLRFWRKSLRFQSKSRDFSFSLEWTKQIKWMKLKILLDYSLTIYHRSQTRFQRQTFQNFIYNTIRQTSCYLTSNSVNHHHNAWALMIQNLWILWISFTNYH